ncbi:glycoside hydrolase/phage tail family protein [Fretibacter rubidus]|uniref:baseplate multidomain protein megatron n=1 Tax=Fretibacter rubidus TaxID=570162 RepID=UPI00352B38E0
MTTVLVSGARAVGAQLGSAVVQSAGQVALAYAGNAISSVFDNRNIDGPRLNQFHLLTSRDGAPMARCYGRVRLAGQVIWASNLKETASETQAGGKGGPTQTNYSYTMSFAIGLCEGEIQSVDQIWVNGAPLPTAGLTMRVYNGREAQDPDPIIAAIEPGPVPAFRGTAYIVFEDFPLDDYGARLPQINVQVTRLAPNASDRPRLETQITGVHLLPSSGEFAYSPDVIEDISNSGAANPINMNNLSGDADIIRAIDQLETALPNCKNISLVISWFGDDLRVGECRIQPAVETGTRLLEGTARWRVCDVTRADAYIVSKDAQGRPNYGGTPSDDSIVKTIRILSDRGFKVMIYPFILMDIPPDNNLPALDGATGQPAFPWRGRISCADVDDMTATASDQVTQFFGTATPNDFGVSGDNVIYNGPDEMSFRRFILHYAHLAELAGGVERFIIGSEMVGLTTIRSSRTHYPAVTQLMQLAADARTVLRPETKISYAADWSEYFGHHPQDGSGDVTFHLDPLWMHPAIDAVGIDAYFPLSDWRDGTDHLDADKANSPYDTDYLKANIEGGEGYDYYYADTDARDEQIRTEIFDSAHAKSWVFRNKDIRSWWYQPHINRIDGVETTASPWVPRSKPFWLTEIGCPAIDKGANQPNVFYDPKSSEGAAPYYSSAARDDLIQRRYLEAFLTHYSGAGNPQSNLFDGPMIDTDASHIWCWDARPFPDFPARDSIWSDGGNWERGHWITGRMGLVAVADVVADLAQQTGLVDIDTSKIQGLLEGYLIDRPMSARAAIGPLAMVYGFEPVETADGLSFAPTQGATVTALDVQDLVAQDGGPMRHIKHDPETELRDVRLHFIDGARDFQSSVVSAKHRDAETVRILDINAPIVMDASLASITANRLLFAAQNLDAKVQFILSPARQDISVGDVVSLPGETGAWQITELDGPQALRASARAYDIDMNGLPFNGTTPGVIHDPVWSPKPQVLAIDIPNYDGSDRRGPLVGAFAVPFNFCTISAGGESVTATEPVKVGALLGGMAAGPIGRWDYGTQIDIYMPALHISSVEREALLSGANRFAVETAQGWEIFQARDIVLTGPDQYRLSTLLRGLAGTDQPMGETIVAGARVIWLGQGWVDMALDEDAIGTDISVTGVMAGRQSDPYVLPYTAAHLRPLSPVHGRIDAGGDGSIISWIRRSRSGGDSWAGLDIPLGEEREFYAVKVNFNNGGSENFTVDTPLLLLPTIHQADITRVTVAQGSRAYGYGPPLTITPS